MSRKSPVRAWHRTFSIRPFSSVVEHCTCNARVGVSITSAGFSFHGVMAITVDFESTDQGSIPCGSFTFSPVII